MRKRLSAAERRQLILQKAIELFAQQGFRATRVKDIAERVGTSDALVFQHFPTKRDLYNAILDELCARRHFTEIERLLYYSPDYDLEDVLTRLSAWILERTEAEPAWLRLILYASLEQDEGAPGLIAEHFQRIIDYVAYEVAEGQRAGNFKPGNAELLARDFFAGVLGLGVMRTIARDSRFRLDALHIVAAEHVATFLRGIAARQATAEMGTSSDVAGH
ncbi:MAG: helix-turn-helix domain containing protein [Gammaproteobacteria bacterium]|nr:helix-turn-helix domain containing protein [Gammaproteobacteria bacterium]